MLLIDFLMNSSKSAFQILRFAQDDKPEWLSEERLTGMT
jgi:hypothetical protein